MKAVNLWLIPALIILFAVGACKKSKPATTAPKKNILSCDKCQDTAIAIKGTGYYCFLPNTFTPNGDGMNDVLTFYSEGVADTDLQIFVMNAANDTVQVITKPNTMWWGEDKAGKKLPSGDYPTRVHFKTTTGLVVNTSVCISILQYNSSGCLPTNGKKCWFPNQFDPVKQTFLPSDNGEKICP